MTRISRRYYGLVLLAGGLPAGGRLAFLSTDFTDWPPTLKLRRPKHGWVFYGVFGFPLPFCRMNAGGSSFQADFLRSSRRTPFGRRARAREGFFARKLPFFSTDGTDWPPTLKLRRPKHGWVFYGVFVFPLPFCRMNVGGSPFHADFLRSSRRTPFGRRGLGYGRANELSEVRLSSVGLACNTIIYT